MQFLLMRLSEFMYFIVNIFGSGWLLILGFEKLKKKLEITIKPVILNNFYMLSSEVSILTKKSKTSFMSSSYFFFF